MQKPIKQFLIVMIRYMVAVLYIFHPIGKVLKSFHIIFYSEWTKRKLKACGHTSIIASGINIVGGKCIKIGNNTTIQEDVSITAWTSVFGQSFTPTIEIGDDCGIGARAHITAINRIVLGNGVLLGKNILITDNSHGDNSFEQLNSYPCWRPLTSKGDVVIEDGVWIGNNACILPGVHIGKNVIIAANSVVTKDIPENCVVGGNPAIILKEIK